jgi:RHS repeat-associated protein
MHNATLQSYAYDNAFGVLQPKRHYTLAEEYKFGYQGSEMDNEINGATGSMYTTFYRLLDTRIVQWKTPDPKSYLTPWESPYVSMGNNPITFTDIFGDTKEERDKAVRRARQHVNKGTKYPTRVDYSKGRFMEGPGGVADCSGMISDILNNSGYPNHRGAGVDGATNGVALIVSTSKEIELKNLEVGSLVTFRTGRSNHQGPNGKYDHIGIVSNIERDDEGNIVTFDFIHSSGSGAEEFTWDVEANRSNEWGRKDLALTGAYKWDKDVTVLPVFEVKAEGKGFETIESIKPSASDIPETLEPI